MNSAELYIDSDGIAKCPACGWDFPADDWADEQHIIAVFHLPKPEQPLCPMCFVGFLGAETEERK